jgi:hypothetical protein
LLNILAKRSGGLFFNISGEFHANEVIPKLGNNQGFGFLYATYDHDLISEVLPAAATLLTNNCFKLVGRIKRKAHHMKTKMTLHYGIGSKVLSSVDVVLDVDNRHTLGIVPRYWGIRCILN